MKTASELVAEERKRQIEKLGYDQKHDSFHQYYELTRAAICYANRATQEGMSIWQNRTPNDWPFDEQYWRPLPHVPGNKCPIIEKEDSIRMLVKACALMQADIDRLINEKE